jgi:hypothetical protein
MFGYVGESVELPFIPAHCWQASAHSVEFAFGELAVLFS